MRESSKSTNTLSVLTGAFLLLEGVWGLFSPVVFGILSTNLTHAIIHILLGATALVLGLKHRAKGFDIFLGLLLAVVGFLYFLPVTDALIVNLFNVNKPVAILNIILGVLLLALSTYKNPARAEKHYGSETI